MKHRCITRAAVSVWHFPVLRLVPVGGLALAIACASPVARSSIQAGDVDVDVRVTDFNVPVVVSVGQTIGIQPPMAGVDWQVDYDVGSLTLVTPAGELASPGPRGWVWRATRSAESDLVLTSVPRCPMPPCPPNVIRFTLKVEVKP